MKTSHLFILTSILNSAVLMKRQFAIVKKNKFTIKLLDLLVHRGYIQGFKITPCGTNLIVYIKYDEHGYPAFRLIKTFSKPGKRLYCSLEKLKLNVLTRLTPYSSSFNTIIITTSRGLMPIEGAIKNKLGGELLLVIS